MAKYLFFPAADKAQDKIWDYTVERWGENQVMNYITGLHEHLQALADKKKHWRHLPGNLLVPADLHVDVFFNRYQHHYVFSGNCHRTKLAS